MMSFSSELTWKWDSVAMGNGYPRSIAMAKLDPDARRALMSRFKGRDTRPEMMVRRALHGLGRRFRLQRRDLPGKPDIVLPRDRIAIFVHGCFWHSHEGCSGAKVPRTRPEFWAEKFVRNRERDARVQRELRAVGWTPIVIWECEVTSIEAAEDRLVELGIANKVRLNR